MTVQPYSIPFIVPNVNIVDYLRLNVIVTTQSSPITFQFTSPSLSFLQTSLPSTTLTPSSGLAFPLGSGNTNLPVVSRFAGNGSTVFANGSLIDSTFNFPTGIAMDSSGSMYIADTFNHRIRKITAGVVSTLAGNGSNAFADGNGTNASFNYPTGVAVDSSGNVFVSDTDNNRIRKITSAGIVSTFAGNGTAASTDGNGTNARVSAPQSVVIDSSGNLYVGDFSNNRIRKISPTADVTTLAGGTQGYLDGTGTNARFYNPCGVAVDSSGNVYVADQANQRIRKITSAGVVSTIAGNGTAAFADGTGTNARFSNPYGITVDPLGNVFVSDLANQRIRRITSTGVVTTIAGTGSLTFNDGNGILATFTNPRHLLIDSTGTMYVVDQGNHRIRKLVGLNVDNSLLPFTSTGTSAITVPASTSQTLNFGVPSSFLSSLTISGTWILTLYASLTTSTSPTTITCQIFNGTTLLTSGTTSITVSSMTVQPYTIPFIVPTANIPDWLELDVIVTTQSSPITFQFTSPNMSFLQTSFPLTSQYGNPTANGTDSAYHGRSTHMFFGQGVTTGAGTLGVYSVENNVTGQGGSIGLGARSTDQQYQIQARLAGVVDGSYIGAFIAQVNWNGALNTRFRIEYTGTTYFTGYTTDGTVVFTGGNGRLSNASDRRGKTDIVYMTEYATDKLLALKPARYSFKTNPTVTNLGFIAQDVETIIPEAVDGKKYEYEWEINEDGTPKLDSNSNLIFTDRPRYRGFSDRPVIATLVKGFQELVERVKVLEAKLASQTPQ